MIHVRHTQDGGALHVTVTPRDLTKSQAFQLTLEEAAALQEALRRVLSHYREEPTSERPGELPEPLHPPEPAAG